MASGFSRKITPRGEAETGEHGQADEEEVSEPRGGAQSLHRREYVEQPAVHGRPGAEREKEPDDGDDDE